MHLQNYEEFLDKMERMWAHSASLQRDVASGIVLGAIVCGIGYSLTLANIELVTEQYLKVAGLGFAVGFLGSAFSR